MTCKQFVEKFSLFNPNLRVFWREKLADSMYDGYYLTLGEFVEYCKDLDLTTFNIDWNYHIVVGNEIHFYKNVREAKNRITLI